MRLGVFGGTFDPIHLGHLIIAQEILDRGVVDRVLFVPAGNPWMKSAQAISPAEHRLAMVPLAIESNPEFLMSDLEIKRTGPTYTTDTLEQLSNLCGKSTKLFLVVGSDTLADLAKWNTPHRLLDLSTVVLVNRAGVKPINAASLEPFGEAGTERLICLETPPIAISSTDIRQRVAEGRSIRYLVPAPVEDYIIQHELYLTYRRRQSENTK